MKIRSDYVTNSSSSYVSIHFRCKKLREILDSYQEHLNVVQYGISGAVSDDSFDFDDEWDNVSIPSSKYNIIDSLLDFIESSYLETDEEQEKFQELSEELLRNAKEIYATIDHVEFGYSRQSTEDDVGGEHEIDIEYTLENGIETYHTEEKIDGEIVKSTSLPVGFSQNVINKQPLLVELTGTQYEGRIQRIERIHSNDWVKIVREADNPYSFFAIDIRNQEGSLGHIKEQDAKNLAPLIDRGLFEEKGRVAEVTPLSQRSKGCKTALLSVWLYPKGWDFTQSDPVVEKKVDTYYEDNFQEWIDLFDNDAEPEKLSEIELVGTQTPERIERIEHVKAGDKVQLILENKESKRQIIVCSKEGALGSIDGLYFYALVEGDRYARVGRISSVTPLSKRSSRCKKPLIKVILYPKGWDMNKDINEDLKYCISYE